MAEPGSGFLQISLSSPVSVMVTLLLYQGLWALCPGAQDLRGISVPSVDNPAFSVIALAASCCPHSQTPTHTGEGFSPGRSGVGGGSAPRGGCSGALNGPIEVAWAW